MDDKELRRQVGMTQPVIDQAVAGQSLAPEIVERLAAFLAHQTDM